MKFYVLKECVNKVRHETGFWYLKPHNNGDAPHCPACHDYIGSLISLPPYNIALELWNKGFGDVAFGPGDHLLVSERFKILWEEHGLKGLEWFGPVTVKKVVRHKRSFKDEPPQYFVTSVVYGKGVLDQKSSGFEWEKGKEPTCSLCKEGAIKRWKSHMLLPDTWDGSNIFRPIGLSGSIMTDQLFKDFVDQFKITSCYLIPADTFAHDFYPQEDKSGEE
jgi:hypothetical protein